MKGEMKSLVFAAVAAAALSGVAEEPKRYGFDHPYVIVAEEVDAYLSGEGNAMTKEGLEKYADSILAGGKVTHVFWCPVAGRANYDSKATDPIWKGLEKSDTLWGIEKKVPGVACSGTTPEQMAANKRWAENAKKLHDAGIDPYRVWIDRTHAKGAKAWLTIRMTDLQYCYLPKHFRTPTYFTQNEFLLSTPGEPGGGSPNLMEPEVRSWLKKIVCEVADRYLDADGFEFDFVSGCDTPYARVGSKTLGKKMMTAFISDLSQSVKSITRNSKLKTGLRLMPDTNELTVRQMSPRGTDILLPFAVPGLMMPCREWNEIDRVAPRVMPGADISSLTAPQVAGWVSWMRGWDFPGIMLANVEKAAPAVRAAVFSGDLVDLKKTVRGTRVLDLALDAHRFERETPCTDWRVRYPWKLDRSWTYEFALQVGSVAEKGVEVEISYQGDKVPAEILLNGYKSLSSKKGKNGTVYAFAKDSIINWRNHVYIPAQGADAATVTAAVVRID